MTCEQEALLQSVMNKLRSLIAFDTGVIYLREGRASDLTAVFASGRNAQWLPGLVVRRGEGATGRAAAHLATRVDQLASEDFSHSSGELRREYASCAVTPLVIDGDCIGAITLYDARPRHFTSEHARALELVGVEAAAALREASSGRGRRDPALLDAATGLFNSAGFDAEMTRMLDRCRAGGRALGVMGIRVLSTDAIGDELLRAVARALRGSFREADVVCRTGSDVFAALMLDAPASAVDRAVRRVRRSVEELRAALPDEDLAGLRLAVGWAVFPDDARAAEELLSVALERRATDERGQRETVEVGVT